MIERAKGIADYITEKAGVDVSDRMVKRLARRQRDPLPVRRFGARLVADARDLDAWIGRQWRG